MVALPDYMETNENVKAWKDYLMTIPNDELVGFLLDRMGRDINLFTLVRTHFINRESNYGADEIIKAFDQEIDIAYDCRDIDAGFVIAFAENFMHSTEELPEEHRKPVYQHMLDRINDGVVNWGLGWPDDDFEVEMLQHALEGKIQEEKQNPRI